jgi:protein TonB
MAAILVVGWLAPANSAKPMIAREDYPLDAVRNGWEGTAVAELRINTEGRVSACRIVKSTGHKVLDDATCNLFVRRAKFHPAIDEFGRPMEDVVVSPPIEWRLP